MYPEVVFLRIVTTQQNKKDKSHTIYVSMLVKLPSPKKSIDTLQQKLDELVEILLQVDDAINILTFDND